MIFSSRSAEAPIIFSEIPEITLKAMKIRTYMQNWSSDILDLKFGDAVEIIYEWDNRQKGVRISLD